MLSLFLKVLIVFFSSVMRFDFFITYCQNFGNKIDSERHEGSEKHETQINKNLDFQPSQMIMLSF